MVQGVADGSGSRDCSLIYLLIRAQVYILFYERELESYIEERLKCSIAPIELSILTNDRICDLSMIWLL